MTPVEFLSERIAEDEAGANDKHDQYECDLNLLAFFGDCECDYPARVMAECAAKRRIVERHSDCDDVSYGDASTCPDIRDLASVYADHPDYDQEWAL